LQSLMVYDLFQTSLVSAHYYVHETIHNSKMLLLPDSAVYQPVLWKHRL